MGARQRRAEALHRRAPLGSGWVRVARGGSGAKAPPLAARPNLDTYTHTRNCSDCFKTMECEEIARLLQSHGFKAAHYHGKMRADDRSRLLQDWTNNITRIMVATVAFGMGIDKADVRFVIHNSVPKTMEGFYQESGRAGRDGLPSVSLVYYGVEDKRLHQYLMSMEEEKRQKKQQEFQQQRGGGGSAGGSINADSARLDREKNASFEAIVDMCEQAKCRRHAILSFFGEVQADGKRIDMCKGTCDFCKNPDKVKTAVAALEGNDTFGGVPIGGYTGIARRCDSCMSMCWSRSVSVSL